MKSPKPTLYLQAVQVAQSRPTLSATNLKTALGCTEPQAKTFMRVMRERGILGKPVGALGRSPCLQYQAPGDHDSATLINLFEPERSTLANADVTAAEVLDADGQAKLRELVDAISQLEDQKDTLTDAIKACYDVAKTKKISPPALRKAIRVIRKAKHNEYFAEAALIELYLLTLGEMIEDVPAAPRGSVH